MKPALLVLAALLAVAGLSSAFAPQDPVREREIIVVSPKRPWSTTVILESELPFKVLDVPAGQRFVLQDLWGFQHDEFPHTSSDSDRFWMERVYRGGREVVFDVHSSELPNPMSWQGGPVFGPGDELWLNYIFDGDKKSDAIRRYLITGYLEDL